MRNLVQRFSKIIQFSVLQLCIESLQSIYIYIKNTRPNIAKCSFSFSFDVCYYSNENFYRYRFIMKLGVPCQYSHSILRYLSTLNKISNRHTPSYKIKIQIPIRLFRLIKKSTSIFLTITNSSIPRISTITSAEE